ncbi:MAG: hypothetical protein OEU54_00180 [Gemmatimonadota bacterium]|nr:hypothetical protein [Gemmatimonadota bacterium]
MRERIAIWLDLRPDEIATVSLSFLGAFFTLGFLVLGRSIREAFYLTRFEIETLPYITAAVAVLSVPTVFVFARLLVVHRPQAVFAGSLVVLSGGLLALWPAVSSSRVAVVGFYLWTALGTMLVTSGFWLVTAELFPIRGAKRVFGLVGAGGTAGAMVVGNVLALVSDDVALALLIPALVAMLGLLLLVQLRLPRLDAPTKSGRSARTSVRDGFRLALTDPHLRTIASLVAISTVASTLVDFQFKDLARSTFDTGEALAGFFGAFYGWTGGVALIIQLFVSARLLSRAGIAITVAVLPTVLLLGSAGLLIVPTLLTATLVRGGDNALRKSLHRAVLEVLYVPVPATVRRRTKTFIDSVADSAAEGVGAAIVLVMVTAVGLPSRWLSIVVGLLALAFLLLARRVQTSYAATVREELRAGARDASGAHSRDLLDVEFTRTDLRPVLDAGEVMTPSEELAVNSAVVGETALVQALVSDVAPGADVVTPSVVDDGPRARAPARGIETERILRAGRPSEILELLESSEEWGREWVPHLTRLLARDSLYPVVTERLRALEEDSIDHLAAQLLDPAVDFAIRRRVPAVLARYAAVEADEALLGGVVAPRFEVRYRSAIGLVVRRRDGLPEADEAPDRIWLAIRGEVSRERPVWELQRLLDDDRPDDGMIAESVDARGALSLEHTFRLLSLVLDADAVSSAYRGLGTSDERLKSLSLEYLDQALPDDVQIRLWPFIGDLSQRERARGSRPLDQVVSDLVTTNATYFVSEEQRAAIRELLDDDSESS